MDYEAMSSNDFKNEFARRRELIYSKVAKLGSLAAEKVLFEEYDKLCEDATMGDPVAQDVLAEWYRNGNQIVPENIEFSNKWLILAGSNGNKFSLDRLKLHFGYTFDRIINVADFGKISARNHINEYNYQYVLGRLICQFVVEDMHIDPLELSKNKAVYLPFSTLIMRRFDRSIDSAVDKVLEELRKK